MPGDVFSHTDMSGKSIEDYAHIIFYYHFNTIEQALLKDLDGSQFHIREKLSNNVFLISDNMYIYPFNLALLPAQTLWQERTLEWCSRHQVEKIKHRFALFPVLLKALQEEFKTAHFHLHNGQIIYTLEGLTKPFDYASLCDDLLFSQQEGNISGYLKHFHLQDLDCTSAYPTVSIRSQVHLRARPQSMSLEKNGYAICAATDSQGLQTPARTHSQKTKRSFFLWQKRSERYLPRQNYTARAIIHRHQDDFVIALIGEQIASIALFPSLVKSALEHADAPKAPLVNLVAHNEDILTIASPSASWRWLNEANIKARTLFKMIAEDGSDPLTLFERMRLPNHGVGIFTLHEVPAQFFELTDTATNLKHTMPPGHHHYLNGLAYECIHEWGLAIAEFQKALRLDANDADILHALGSALLEIGSFKEGYPFLKKAFAKLPEDAEVANNLGRTSLK
ncbi:MAG: tetratricopeptide repeat protein, partial [Minisyncoccia bacterium]